MNRNARELLKMRMKLRIRSWFPEWFLKLIRRRQVSLSKMQTFLANNRPLNGAQTPVESIAIVIPCYGHAQYLNKTFESITRQTRLPEQVIFIDDKSKDQTKEILNQLISDYRNANPDKIHFTVFSNDRNLGQALSINKGVELASTDLVMILNDDDYLRHDAVEIMLSLFKRYPDLALIGGDMTPFDNNEWLDSQDKHIKKLIDPDKVNLFITTPADALKFEDYSCLHITHSGSTFVKIKAESAGLYRPKKNRVVPFSDRDFQIRVNLLYPVGTTDQIHFCFWRSNSSVDSGVNS